MYISDKQAQEMYEQETAELEIFRQSLVETGNEETGCLPYKLLPNACYNLVARGVLGLNNSDMTYFEC